MSEMRMASGPAFYASWNVLMTDLGVTKLSGREGQLFLLLVRRKTPVDIEQIVECIYDDPDMEPEDPYATLRVRVTHIRNKVTPLGVRVVNSFKRYSLAPAVRLIESEYPEHVNQTLIAALMKKSPKRVGIRA